jgi:hypothetical protein
LTLRCIILGLVLLLAPVISHAQEMFIVVSIPRVDGYRVEPTSRSRTCQNRLYASTATAADDMIGATSQTTNQRFHMTSS